MNSYIHKKIFIHHMLFEHMMNENFLMATSYLKDKENVASGFHGATGSPRDRSFSAGNDRTDHLLAQALDRCAIKANDRVTSLDGLAFRGNVLEALALEFNRIKSQVDDQLNAVAHRDPEGMAPWKQFDQIPCHRSYGHCSRWIDSQTIA